MPEKPQEHWYDAAANAIVREGKTLFKYSVEKDLGLTSTECENIQRTKKFQEILRTQRNLYYKELALDGTLTKTAVEGQMIFAITKLLENGQYDKAVAAMMSLAKIKGWQTDSASVNIFQQMTGGDISKLKETLAKQSAIKTQVN